MSTNRPDDAAPLEGCGFVYGDTEVYPMFDYQGCVNIGIKTPKTELQVYVTKTGKVRIFTYGKNKEWKEQDR